MIREEYLRRLVDEAYVDLYLSGTDGQRIYWPWRMQPPHESSPGYRNACESYLIDSAPQCPSTGNKDVLDEAHRVGADAALLADYFPFEMYEENLDPKNDPEEWSAYQEARREYGDAYNATIHRVCSGFELAEQHDFDGEIIIPLQAPYADCLSELPNHDRYAIGGLNRSSDRERVEASKEVRSVAPDAWVHGLGWGARDGLVSALHKNPNLIDSVDYSTPMQTAIRGVDPGDERMSVQAARAGAQLIEDLRRFSPYTATPRPEELREDGQAGLDQMAARGD